MPDFDLSDRSVAILATDGFEESELTEPLDALKDAGASVRVVSIPETPETIRAWSDGDWSGTVSVDQTVEAADVDDFDSLVLPGGVMNPDTLRMHGAAVDFVNDFFEAGKPVAAICHGPWMVVEADAARGRTMTSYPSIRTDVKNAGAHWVNESVVVDQGLVTSRSPKDMDDFVRKVLEETYEGVHEGQHA